METSEFLNSDEASTLLLRHEIFNAARLAFHIAMDKFIMAEFDVPEHEELLGLIKEADHDWYFGG